MKFRKHLRGFHRSVSERGSQLVELAFVVPVLTVLAFGAWDFGSAFTMKQKLTNAVREGARIVVSNSIVPTPSCPVGTNPPCAITAAEQDIAQYLDNAGLNASCLTTATVSGSYPTWTWTCNSITLTIDRATGAGLESTVSITYPISWSMNHFFGVTVIPNQISTQVTMPNLTY